MRRLRDKIGIIIVKHLASKNPSYPDDIYTCKKFVALAEELEHLFTAQKV